MTPFFIYYHNIAFHKLPPGGAFIRNKAMNIKLNVTCLQTFIVKGQTSLLLADENTSRNYAWLSMERE